MPFPPNGVPLENADVRIFFDGLLILSPDKDIVTGRTCCEATIVTPHHDGHHHSGHILTLDIFEETLRPPTPLVARFVGPLQGLLEIGFGEKSEGVGALVSNDWKSITSALDLKKMHQLTNFTPRRPSIRLYEGQLRTARRSDQKVWRRRLDDNNGECVELLPAIATILEARLNFNNRVLHIQTSADSCELKSDGKKYLIYIRNSRQTSIAPTGRLSDFRHYYHEPGLMVSGDKWDIYFELCGPSMEDTTRIPCMSVLYDG